MSIIFFLVPNLTFLLIISLFFQKAALAISILAFNSSSHLAASVIQLPKYLYRLTCSNAMLFKIMEHFTFLALLITVPLVFFTFIAILYCCNHWVMVRITICSWHGSAIP